MRRFRVGVMDQIFSSRFSPTAAMRASYLGAVSAGADSFWVGDHVSSVFARSIATSQHMGAARLVPNIDAILEPWTTLGHLATLNRLGRRRLGVGVTDPARRNPVVTAQAAATLHLLTRGRAILGIGTGERVTHEPYGVDWTKPVARLEEALATIRALWDSDGELVSRDSPYFPLRSALFALPPYRGKWPEIWIAAHGPQMLRITGRYGDAWFPEGAVVTRKQGYAERLDMVRSAASDAGRDPQAVTPAGTGFVVTGFSRHEVDEALESDAVKSAALLAPAEIWARHGAQHPLGADAAGGHDIVPQLLDEETVLSYTKQVPASLMRELTLNGRPREVIEQVAEYRDQGLRYLVIANIGILQPSLAKGMASNLNFTRIIRGLKKL